MNALHREVVVTGLGPVTSIGVGCASLWKSLSESHSGVRVQALPLDLGMMAELPLATMPHPGEIPECAAHLEYLRDQDCLSYRDLAYALAAISLAFTDAGLPPESRESAGIIQAFEAPGVEVAVSRLLGMMAAPESEGPPRVYDLLAPSFYNMQSFFYVQVLGKGCGAHGFSTAVHNACSSGAFALEIAAERIRSGLAEVMVVVGAEAFETAVRLEWFRRLELYAKSGECRPFSERPTGFFVGEGAAALVLESTEHARRRGAKPYACYRAGAFSHQAWKQTIPDLRAARLAGLIAHVLQSTGSIPTELDLIVPHGAATLLSDGYEAACLKQALGCFPPPCPMAFFKPMVGHMLGASSLIDVVCAMLVLRHQTIPCPPPQDRLTYRPGSNPKIQTVLKTSTGFTGHDAAMMFSTAFG